MTYPALLSAFWRLMILTMAMILLSPAFLHAQRVPPLGFYLGFISEETRFDGGRANAREAESGHIGVYVGRWSVGAVGKSLGRSYILVSPGTSTSTADLEIAGLEVGRVFRTGSYLQPMAHLLVGQASVERRVFVNGQLPGTSSAERTPVVELSGGIGVPVWRVARFETRAGVRLGGRVSFDTVAYSTSAIFLQARTNAGWLGAWRKQ